MSNDEPTTGLERDRSNQPTLLIGKVFGNFRLDGVLGEGAYGVVFKARDLVTDRDVALKMLRVDDANSRESLLNEARKAAKLQHVNIVPILHVLSEPEIPLFVVMEYVKGETLDKVIRQEAPLPAPAVLVAVRDIARGLSYAHCNGIVHLDIKPANILLDGNTGHAKITDFGMAMHHSERWTRGSGGTLRYMAPEQVQGKTEQYDGRTDIWALGVILYELMTGKKPFGADNSSSVNQVIEEIVRVHPKPPSQWNSRVSAQLDAICLKCLEKDIATRYPSVPRLIDDIDAAEKELLGHDREAQMPELPAANSTRANLALRGCLIVVGTILAIAMMFLRIHHPEDVARFLKQLLKVF